MINVATATKDKSFDYLKSHGKAGARTLEILGKNYDFLQVFNTKAGYEILKDAVQLHEEAFTKIASFDATPDDKATYKAIEKIIFRWSARLRTYEAELGKVMK